MSVVGVDLGALNTVIAVARNRGVDVVCLLFHRIILLFNFVIYRARAWGSFHLSPIVVTDVFHYQQITNEVSNRATPLVSLSKYLASTSEKGGAGWERHKLVLTSWER